MPAMPHVCPKCTYEHPCYFSEGDIVALSDEAEAGPMEPWTGIVLDVEKEKEGNVYRVMWGKPPPNLGPSAAYAKRSGEHRRDELQRFLVPLILLPSEPSRPGGGERERVPHRFEAPTP